MAVVAVISSPNNEKSPDSTPRRLVDQLSSVEIEVVQFKRDGARASIYLWMRAAPEDEFDSTLAEDPKITDHHRLESAERGSMYRVTWDVDSPVIQCMARADGTILRAHGEAAEWRLTILFEDGSDASAFRNCCSDRDIPLSVDRLKSVAELLGGDGDEISGNQREALVLAYRRGYFEEPRAITQAELADELDISSSAVGGRLRRGLATLVRDAFLE